jgi:hypothetical protein
MDWGYGTAGCLLGAVFGASYMQALHENLSLQHGFIRTIIVGEYFNVSLKPIA